MQRGKDAERERCREGEMQRGKDAERESCREGKMKDMTQCNPYCVVVYDCCYSLTFHGDCDLDRVKINKHVFGK